MNGIGIVARTIHQHARAPVVTGALTRSVAAVIGIIALVVVQKSHCHVDARALGIVNRVVDVVSPFVDQDSCGIPVAHALGINSADVSVVSIFIVQQTQTASQS